MRGSNMKSVIRIEVEWDVEQDAALKERLEESVLDRIQQMVEKGGLTESVPDVVVRSWGSSVED
jgi:hypothetical protein